MAPSTLSTDRHTYRELVAKVAVKAKAILPQEVNGRVEGAVKLVLNGDVLFLDDGTVEVGSSDPSKVYHLVGAACECKDFPRAPEGWCRHRIAAGIQKRVTEMMPHEPATEPYGSVQPPAPTMPLPEAPASVNVHLTISGRQVQLTLRDTDEGRLLARLETVLERFPLTATPGVERGEGWCSKHQIQMRQTTKNGRSWWSHRTEQGLWCKG